MSTTPVYSSVVDFVWEWAEEAGDWAKVLVDKLVTSGRQLTESDRRLIHNMFLKSLNVKVELEQPPIPQKPELPKGCQKLSVTSLSEISGVNRLAASQTISFGTNLTVIYGDNGTGKSGYGRILRSLGRGYIPPAPVLGDVYSETKASKSAKIVYSADEESKDYVWNDSQQSVPIELKSLIFFNNESVEVSIDPTRVLLVSPVGFELFRAVSGELTHLEQLHEQLIQAQEVKLEWETQLTSGSAVQLFLSKLNAETNADEMAKLAVFGEEQEKEFVKLEGEQKELNPRLIETDIKNITSQKSEIETIVSKIRNSKSTFTEEFFTAFAKDTTELTELKKGEVQSIFEVAKDNGAEVVESEEFRSFLQSAETYLKKIGNFDFPIKDRDRCIYCNQLIKDDSSVNLLKKYREVLTSLTKSKIDAVERRLSGKKQQIASTDSKLNLTLSSFGETEEEKPVQPECLLSYNSALAVLQSRVSENPPEAKTPPEEISLAIDWDAVLQPLTDRVTVLTSAITEKRQKLTNQKELEEKIKTQLSELKDRKLLNQEKSEVESKLKSLKTIKRLQAGKSKLNSASLSRKTSDARNFLVQNRLLESFQEELAVLNKPYLKVELDFKTDKGVSKLLQVIEEEHSVKDILSEGEQKAISLCELLAELRLDPSHCPLVLDDPVTSLDHHFIDDMAKRLVKLCIERQVIIFTHSILLFNAIKQRIHAEHIKKKKLDIKFYEVLRGDGVSGIIQDSGTFLTEEKFGHYSGKVNGILGKSNAEKLARPRELAIEGYEHLRSGIEVFVEEEIFLGAVKRYRKNVTLTRFESVDGALIDKHKETINGVFEKCCGFIDAHSKVDGVNVNPDLQSLKTDLDTITAIRDSFLGKTTEKKLANS